LLGKKLTDVIKGKVYKMAINDFILKVLPYARKAAAELNMPVSVILAQWGVESGGGTSRFAKGGNLAGLQHNKYTIDGGGAPFTQSTTGNAFANYNGNLDLFAKDYVRVMKLSYYDKVRAAGTVDETVKALVESKFDAGHYGGTGANIKSWINSYKLTQYDGAAAGSVTTEKKTRSCPDCPLKK
jgi:flagellum-specific peptidoglycan hydrolase FlgJ